MRCLLASEWQRQSPEIRSPLNSGQIDSTFKLRFIRRMGSIFIPAFDVRASARRAGLVDELNQAQTVSTRPRISNLATRPSYFWPN
jgi:hypothetical protein